MTAQTETGATVSETIPAPAEERAEVTPRPEPQKTESKFGEDEDTAADEEESCEAEGAAEDTVIVEDELPASPFPFISSHISNGCLNTLGFCNTEYGWVPITSRVPLPVSKKSPAVPVAFGVESQSPTLNTAMVIASQVLANRANVNAQEREVKALVERARAGDQNAMAILALVRRNATMGNERARCAYAHIRDYIRENPASAIHGEISSEPKMWVHIWLANGPKLTDPKLREFGATFGEDEPVFLQGIVNFRYSDRVDKLVGMYDALRAKILEIGKMFGEARALQMVREPQSNLRMFSPRVAWELGQ